MLLERQEREYANLRAAMQWSLEQPERGPGREMALRLAWALGDFWDLGGLNSEWWEFLQQALVGSEGVAASVRAKTLSVAANYAMSRGGTDRAEALCQERGSLSSGAFVVGREPRACEAAGRHKGLIGFHSYISGWIALSQGETIAAHALVEQSLALWREIGDRWTTTWAAHLWGAAEFLRESSGVHRSPIERVDYEPAVAAARTLWGSRRLPSRGPRGGP
jgi:hypothetical protein